MADAGPIPPSYDDAQAANKASQELKSSFENLKNDHNDIQELFRTVRSQLQNAPEIGDGHLLLEKWETLRSVCVPLWFNTTSNAAPLYDVRDISGYTGIHSRMQACVLGFSRVSFPPPSFMYLYTRHSYIAT